MGRPLSYRPQQRTACGEYALCRTVPLPFACLCTARSCSAKAAHIC